MTMDDLISRQVRIEHQDKPHCGSASIDRDAANAFQQYVNENLARRSIDTDTTVGVLAPNVPVAYEAHGGVRAEQHQHTAQRPDDRFYA